MKCSDIYLTHRRLMPWFNARRYPQVRHDEFGTEYIFRYITSYKYTLRMSIERPWHSAPKLQVHECGVRIFAFFVFLCNEKDFSIV